MVNANQNRTFMGKVSAGHPIDRKSSKKLPEIPQSSSSQRKTHMTNLTYDTSMKPDDKMIFNSNNTS